MSITKLQPRPWSDYTPDQIGNWVAVDQREFPWATIGQALEGHGNGSKSDHILSAREILERTGLDKIKVHKVPVLDGETKRQIPKLFATYYDDPATGERHHLAGVSDKYEVVDPTDALSAFDGLVGAIDGAHYTAGWHMPEKAMMGVTITLPMEVVVGPGSAEDRLAVHLLGVNSFDGSTGLNGGVVMTRWWCMNQFTPRFQNTPRSFCLRHTRNVRQRAADVGEQIGVTRAYLEQLDVIANSLYAQSMTDRQFERFIKGLEPWAMPTNASPIVVERVEARREAAMEAWRAAHNANITGTRWGALQVVGEFAEWGRTVKGSHRTGTDATRQRAIGTLVHPSVAGLVNEATARLAA